MVAHVCDPSIQQADQREWPRKGLGAEGRKTPEKGCLSSLHCIMTTASLKTKQLKAIGLGTLHVESF